MEPRELIELRAGTPVAAGSITVIPVEARRIRVRAEGDRLFAHAAQHPYAFVIRNGDQAHAIDARGAPLDLDDLRARVAGLAPHLRR